LSKMRKNSYKIIIPFLISLMGIMILGGCKEEVPVEFNIVLPSTPILSNYQSWAVVTDSYLRVTSERSRNSSVVATLRKGDILEIISSQLDNEGSLLWFEVMNDDIRGWVYGTSIKMFENREQAETASRETNKEKN
jgi:uncharacterized lipoprotein YajG